MSIRRRDPGRIKLDAYGLDRPNFWGCDRCGSHNLIFKNNCGTCGKKSWKILFLEKHGYMTELLSIGYPHTMVQNQIYALPSRRCLLFTDATTPTIQQSTDVAFSANAALTLTNGQAEVAGGFIRCTSGNITITLKPF